MGWLKRDFIKKAFGAIGFTAYDFDVPAEQKESALQTLDSMMAAWNGDGIRLGWPLPSDADTGDESADSNAPDWANLAIWSNLALLLGAEIGRDVSPVVQGHAVRGYAALLARAKSEIPEQQMPSGTLAGAGNKRRLTLDPPTSTLDAGPGEELDFGPAEE